MCLCLLFSACCCVKKGQLLPLGMETFTNSDPTPATHLSLSTTQTTEWKKVGASKKKKHEIVIKRYPIVVCHTETVQRLLGKCDFRHLQGYFLSFPVENFCFANFTIVKVESRYVLAPTFTSPALFVALCCYCTRLSHPLCVTGANDRKDLSTFSHEFSLHLDFFAEIETLPLQFHTFRYLRILITVI